MPRQPHAPLAEGQRVGYKDEGTDMEVQRSSRRLIWLGQGAAMLKERQCVGHRMLKERQ